MTQEIVKVLQDKAQALTGERRRKSKTVPEQLVDADTIKDRYIRCGHVVRDFKSEAKIRCNF